MSDRLSRRKIAHHVAAELVAGNESVVAELAAFLIETGRQAELELIVRDIEAALQEHGVVIADVTSARDLTDASRGAIIDYLRSVYQARDVKLRESVDPSLLGGVRVATADGELDASLKRRIMKLKASKV